MKLDLGRENETQNESSKNEQPERPSKRSRRQRHVEIPLREDSSHERHEKEIPVQSSSKSKKKKKRKTKAEKEHETTSIDPPIDPDEPTYCLCDQVSYGEMIGCDNDDCEREWFHFSCVGLTTKPKGKWYCPTCRGDRSNQMRP
ncbi:Inhibitor of growth protein 1, partial [Stegodyphus mimosarum]